MSVRLPRLASGVSLGVALALATGRAEAQAAPVNPFSFGVSAGAAVPTGDAASGVKTGYSVSGIVAVRSPTLPVSLRAEVDYTRFGIKDIGGVSFSGVDYRFVSGVANAVLAFSAGPTAVVRPYLIGGVGLYNGKYTGSNVNDDIRDDGTKVGLNGGIGLEIPLSGITGFGEVRYTSVFTEGGNTNWVPIRFGIRF